MPATMEMVIQSRIRRQALANAVTLGLVWFGVRPCWAAGLYMKLIRIEWKYDRSGWKRIDPDRFEITCDAEGNDAYAAGL